VSGLLIYRDFGRRKTAPPRTARRRPSPGRIALHFFRNQLIRRYVMREVLIIDAIRTPLGRRGGALSKENPVSTSSILLKELVKRNNFEPEIVDDVIYGCVSEVGAQSTNLARNIVLTAGWPYTIPGVTLDWQCSSSQQAVHFAANQIASGVHDVVVAGGTEFMSQIPLGANMGKDMGFPFTQS